MLVLERSRRRIALLVGVTATLLAVAGCGGGHAEGPTLTPADLVLTTPSLPADFTPTPLSVTDLVEQNRSALGASRNTVITPPACRPTADAALNEQLRDDNAAVVAARSDTASLVEVVTTRQRDLTADLIATTGDCARTTTVIRSGDLAGARIVTEYTRLDDDDVARAAAASSVPGTGAASVTQRLLQRSTVTRTLADGGVNVQIGYAGYAIVNRGGGPVTVQLVVAGDAGEVGVPAPPAPQPMDDKAFVALMSAAVTAAARAS